MAFCATHAIIHAQLITKGKNHGIQAFIVPIRDISTHKPLPGIEVGDIGPKIGFNYKDNGYLYFRNVRISRKDMLSRYGKVDKDGNFTTKGDPRIGYAVMMVVRMFLTRFSGMVLAIATKITIRYGV